LFVLVVRHFGWSLTTLEFLIFTFGLVTVSFIDLDHMILPDVFTLSGIILGLLGALINPERSFTEALYGVLFGGGFLYAVAWAYFKIKKIEGMGGGDIKLIAWIGAYLGVSSILPVIIYSSFIGAFVGLILMVFKKKGFQSEIPFGPFLAFAALIVMFFPSLDPLFFLK
jgi:leader peptidase (prepilin peptidase)/N-methyltransferase